MRRFKFTIILIFLTLGSAACEWRLFEPEPRREKLEDVCSETVGAETIFCPDGGSR